MMEKTIDVIIPTYHPGREFEQLIERLYKQDCPINKIIIMNTEDALWNKEWDEKYPFLEVHHIPKAEFDHGGTRKKAAGLSEADIMVFMTQDALPADRHLLRNLTAALYDDEQTGAAYARQLPNVRTRADLPQYGIKTYFCSNVCAAYKKDIFEKLGGFVDRTIFNEDMIYAGNLIQAGYKIAYAAEARVIHSHNYSCIQQFHRNFDLGVSQAEHPEIFESVKSEGEGIRLVKQTFSYLIAKKKIWLIPGFIMQSGFKYAGYLAGKKYRKLPSGVIMWCTMNPSYWNV